MEVYRVVEVPLQLHTFFNRATEAGDRYRIK